MTAHLEELGPANIAEIHELIELVQEYDGASFRTSPAEVRSFFDPAREHVAFGARGESGRLEMYGMARLFDTAGSHPSVIISGVVHPAAPRERVKELAAQQVKAARALAVSQDQQVIAVAHLEPWEAERMSVLRAFGFTHAYSYVQMRRSLRASLPEYTPAPGIDFVPITREQDATVLGAHNSFHGEKLDYAVMTPEQWATERAFMDRDWSFLAVDRRGDRPRVVGYIIAARYEQDWQSLGWKEGYIDELSVRSTANVTAGLLIASMRAQRDAGMRYTSMDVTIDHGPDAQDAEERITGYEEIGFSPTAETKVLIKPVELA